MGLGLAGYVVDGVYESSKDQGYAPEQPIPFSHKLHAGENKMECMYCHFNVGESRHATAPTMSVCMGCHDYVATDSPHIQKMKGLYDKGESLEWVKIHHLPEHTYFPHNRHVAAGVSCQECHGPIEEMEKVKQAVDINMGWCLDCHRDNTYVNASQGIGSVNYRSHHDLIVHLNDSGKYSDTVEEFKPLDIHPLTHMNAKTSCSTCHQ